MRCNAPGIIMLSTTCTGWPSTSIPMEILKMCTAATSMIASTTTRIEMIASECPLVSTKVLLVRLMHGSCWSSWVRRRLVIIVLTLRAVGSRIIRLLLIALRVLATNESVTIMEEYHGKLTAEASIVAVHPNCLSLQNMEIVHEESRGRS